MVKISQRKQLHQYLSDKVFIDFLLSEFSQFMENEDNMAHLLMYLECTRYLIRGVVPKINSSTKFDLIRTLDEGRVRQEIRMSWESFMELHDIVSTADIYTRNENKRRTDLRVQIMVALERLGSYGNANSVGKLARAMGISGKFKVSDASNKTTFLLTS